MRLKEARLAANYKQKEIAEVINSSQAVYSRYENAEREPPIDVIKKLAVFYGVSADYLIGLDADIKQRPKDSFLPDELQLITDYRSLSSQGQEYIRQQMYMAKSIYTAGDIGFASMETAAEPPWRDSISPTQFNNKDGGKRK